MEFKENLAKILSQKGMRPAELCDLVDIHRSTVYRYVSGTCIPRSDHLHEIASALNVSERYLLGYEDNSSMITCERKCFTITLRFPQNMEIQSKVQAVSDHEAIGKVLEIVSKATYENIMGIKEDV